MKLKFLFYPAILFYFIFSQSVPIKAQDIFPPFYSREIKTEGDITIEKISLRPLFTVYRTLDNKNNFVFEQLQLLWPFFFYQKTNDRRLFRFYPIIFTTKKFREDGTDADNFILPLLSWGKEPKQGRYFMFLPFGGVAKGHLGKEKVTVALFPLFFRTEFKGWKSTNYLFPLIQTNTGARHAGWRFWPLYGTYRIYRDEKNTDLMEDRKFVLWPFWIKQNRYLHDGLVGKSFISFPFYASYESPSKIEKMYCWPIYKKTTFPKDKGFLYSIAWPLFKYGRGPNSSRYEFFPLFGFKKSENHVKQFYLWPLIRNESDNTELEKRKSLWLVPFYYQTYRLDKRNNTEYKKVKFWPLWKYTRDNSQIRKFEFLSPFWFNDSTKGGFENNYADFFRIFHTNYKKKEWYNTKILFNLIHLQKDKESRKIRVFPFIYNYERSPVKKKVSILGGLVEYKKDGDGKRIKILWIPFGRKSK